MSDTFWDRHPVHLICVTSDQHGMMALHTEKPTYHGGSGRWISPGRTEIGLRTDQYQSKDAPNSLKWRPGFSPIKAKPSKIKPLTVGDNKIKPLTVGDARIVPLTAGDTDFEPTVTDTPAPYRDLTNAPDFRSERFTDSDPSAREELWNDLAAVTEASRMSRRDTLAEMVNWAVLQLARPEAA